MKIEISFDDGQVGDLKAARILKEHGFVGTFYIPSCEVPKTIQASVKEIYEGIAKLGHELGGHTVSHPMDMKLLNDKDLEFEIVNNKLMIEHLLAKKPITKFCYPRGRHDERVREAVKKAGYLEARTTEVLKVFNTNDDPFQTPTTVHMFQRNEYEGVAWTHIAREYFLGALSMSKERDDIVFSLWGHANEIERQGDWQEFENFLIFMNEKLSTQTNATSVAS